MNPLVEVLGSVMNIVLGIEGQRTFKLETDAIDIGRFIRDFEARFGLDGVHRCGEDAVCLHEALMVYDGPPLVPRTLASPAKAEEELAAAGISIDHIDRSNPRVISFSGRNHDSNIHGRIVPIRGWMFLVTSRVERDAQALAKLLDSQLAEVEGLGRG